MKNQLLAIFIAGLMFGGAVACSDKDHSPISDKHQDLPFSQDFSIKFVISDETTSLYKVCCDRNGYVQIFSSDGLLRPRAGEFLFPGTLVKDTQYRPTSDKKIQGLGKYQNQLIYIDENAVFSNGWAGKLYLKHMMQDANIFTGGKDFMFLISDSKKLALLNYSELLWEGTSEEEVRDIKYDTSNNLFWILGRETISVLSPSDKKIEKVLKINGLTCIEVVPDKLIVGTSDGYFEINTRTKKTDWQHFWKIAMDRINHNQRN